LERLPALLDIAIHRPGRVAKLRQVVLAGDDRFGVSTLVAQVLEHRFVVLDLALERRLAVLRRAALEVLRQLTMKAKTVIVLPTTKPLIERRYGEIVIIIRKRGLPERLKRFLPHLLEPLRLNLDLNLRHQVIGFEEIVIHERVDRPYASVLAGIEPEA